VVRVPYVVKKVDVVGELAWRGGSGTVGGSEFIQEYTLVKIHSAHICLPFVLGYVIAVHCQSWGVCGRRACGCVVVCVCL